MDEKRTSGKKWRLALAGAGATLALCLVARRALSGFVAQIETPQPDLCQGFESEGLHCVNLGVTTTYLLKGQDGYLLIDTGYAKDYTSFIDGLARVGVGRDQIKALLLTHGHDDHAGFAARLLEETGARLITHRDALPLLCGEQMTGQGVRSLNGRILVLTALYTLITRRDIEYPPLTPGDKDVILDGDDTQVLRDLGFDARVIHTPGHTADSISVVTPDGKAFCGDAVMNFLPVSGAGLRPIFVADQEQVFASWRKILDSGAQVIYPAHGAPLAAERLAEALQAFRS